MTTAEDVERLKMQVRDLERILVREGAVEASYERQLAEAVRERDEARTELLSIAQQLELERAASAQLRAEVGERMRETAAAQREVCARFMEEQRWYTSRGALSAPLVTEVGP